MGRWLAAGAVALAAVTWGGVAASQSSSPFSGLFGDRDAGEGSPVKLTFNISGDDKTLEKTLRNGSLLTGSLRDKRYTGQDILAAARADYARLLGNLYDEGYYDAVINITLDGREAAQIAPLDAPENVAQVVVAISPGQQFHFSRADIGPIAQGKTKIPPEYRLGEVAGTGTIKAAATAGVAGWRDAGHAKADLQETDITADHPARKVDSRISLAPGPLVTFGQMNVSGLERLREKRLREIAGFPAGHQFDPEDLEAVRKRLRRSGVFSAITLAEVDRLRDGNTLDVDLTVVEQKPRRIGGGAEISNKDGAAISGYWMHRNLWGGAERLRIDGKVSDIGSGTSGQDAQANIRLERPATFARDLTAYVAAGVARMREEDYDSDSAFAGIGLDYYRNDNLTGGIRLEYRFQKVTDDSGTTNFRTIALPVTGIYDKRDVDTDPKKGYWLSGELTPFVGLGDTGSGLRAVLEGRSYYSVGKDDRLTFAGRARLGTVLGPEIAETPRDYLFYSGGGGTVRGQPFESLGAEVIPGPDGPIKTGGMSLAVINAETRFQVREKIGLVAFADAGRVWADSSFKGSSGWQSGAGVGVRYLTPIGPIRLDVAAPLKSEPDTGKGVQLYLGLGQAF
ncbi:outer membrane protein assembly factor [Paracoccus suum]|uniref:Outer membrane protein assembly factor n=1 Tax=Paracoccus suum TaxID=2259340 RepID=A0A344PHP1_9RHOB|nr:autotransporter assembly complex family protein [Paracoccus suum]AXC48896.1 outer membrane protein assembly factor [Paracoccus suum]